MVATLNFNGGLGLVPIVSLAGSGLGFFGAAGFGASVAVGAWQGRTFITSSNGTQQGSECNNVQYLNNQSGILGQAGSGIGVLNIPNMQATLNINFNNGSTGVKTQNPKLYIYDRTNINNNPSGVTCNVVQVIHANTAQDTTGSGNNTWQTLGGSSAILVPTSGPGASGLSPNGAQTVDANHDWYFAISCSPNSIGQKLFALYFYVEYL